MIQSVELDLLFYFCLSSILFQNCEIIFTHDPCISARTFASYFLFVVQFSRTELASRVHQVLTHLHPFCDFSLPFSATALILYHRPFRLSSIFLHFFIFFAFLYKMSTTGSTFEHPCGEITKTKCRRSAAGRRSQASRQCAEQPFLIHRLAHPF